MIPKWKIVTDFYKKKKKVTYVCIDKNFSALLRFELAKNVYLIQSNIPVIQQFKSAILNATC